ncbi:MAG: NUDIX domain-containing protein [Chitinophagaceae bacterium]|nr:NUDIX domain-containing protein [Chitinophagaceae bacterium]MCW5905297.1 NUDIX domain-containing protein [Chitinophagaceae bacterium]
MPQFNIRVYGILQDQHKRILVSDEFIRGDYYTKFPGGGLEFGEGTRDCLKREFKEETKLDITVGKLIYTTDFFQISAFNKTDQIICVYYLVYANDVSSLKTSDIPFDFSEEHKIHKTSVPESFRFIEWNNLNETSVTLPMDKIVVKILKESFG